MVKNEITNKIEAIKNACESHAPTAMIMNAAKERASSVNIARKPFSDLKNEKRFGMVVTGAGEPLDGWISGISELLVDEGIVKCNASDVFDDAYLLSDNVKGDEGRHDLVIIFSDKAKPDIGKLAMWRLRFGSVMWIEDFIADINNYKDDYKSGQTASKQTAEYTSLAEIIDRDSDISDKSDVEKLRQEDLETLLKYPEKFNLREHEIYNIRLALKEEYDVNIAARQKATIDENVDLHRYTIESPLAKEVGLYTVSAYLWLGEFYVTIVYTKEHETLYSEKLPAYDAIHIYDSLSTENDVKILLKQTQPKSEIELINTAFPELKLACKEKAVYKPDPSICPICGRKGKRVSQNVAIGDEWHCDNAEGQHVWVAPHSAEKSIQQKADITRAYTMLPDDEAVGECPSGDGGTLFVYTTTDGAEIIVCTVCGKDYYEKSNMSYEEGKPEASKQKADKIVKGGNSIDIGPLRYREGYDIVETDDNKYYLSVMNGPIEIFDGPIRDTIAEAEKDGIAQMKKDRPQLAKNIGIASKQKAAILGSQTWDTIVKCTKCGWIGQYSDLEGDEPGSWGQIGHCPMCKASGEYLKKLKFNDDDSKKYGKMPASKQKAASIKKQDVLDYVVDLIGQGKESWEIYDACIKKFKDADVFWLEKILYDEGITPTKLSKDTAIKEKSVVVPGTGKDLYDALEKVLIEAKKLVDSGTSEDVAWNTAIDKASNIVYLPIEYVEIVEEYMAKLHEYVILKKSTANKLVDANKQKAQDELLGDKDPCPRCGNAKWFFSKKDDHRYCYSCGYPLTNEFDKLSSKTLPANLVPGQNPLEPTVLVGPEKIEKSTTTEQKCPKCGSTNIIHNEDCDECDDCGHLWRGAYWKEHHEEITHDIDKKTAKKITESPITELTPEEYEVYYDTIVDWAREYQKVGDTKEKMVEDISKEFPKVKIERVRKDVDEMWYFTERMTKNKINIQTSRKKVMDTAETTPKNKQIAASLLEMLRSEFMEYYIGDESVGIWRQSAETVRDAMLKDYPEHKIEIEQIYKEVKESEKREDEFWANENKTQKKENLGSAKQTARDISDEYDKWRDDTAEKIMNVLSDLIKQKVPMSEIRDVAIKHLAVNLRRTLTPDEIRLLDKIMKDLQDDKQLGAKSVAIKQTAEQIVTVKYVLKEEGGYAAVVLSNGFSGIIKSESKDKEFDYFGDTLIKRYWKNTEIPKSVIESLKANCNDI